MARRKIGPYSATVIDTSPDVHVPSTRAGYASRRNAEETGSKEGNMTTVESLRVREALWNEMTEQVLDLYQMGDYPQAVEIAEKALNLAENIYDPHHLNLATSLTNLATLMRAQGREGEAEALYRRAMDIDVTYLDEHPGAFPEATA
jgi:tetratricopeptide (TPR) repeat protein